jgi:hypothetical protein
MSHPSRTKKDFFLLFDARRKGETEPGCLTGVFSKDKER